MPVENSGLIFPKADVQFEAPEGPQTVEFDDGTAHVGEADAPETPVTVDHSELHQPSSTDQFQAPSEPVTVVHSGYEPAAPADPSGDAQAALQEAAADAVAEQEALQEATDDLTAAQAQAGQPDAAPAAAPAEKTAGGAQTKVVKPPADQPAAGTDGAQTK